MAIIINENSKVIVQGMTGSEGQKHTARMLDSGTNIVGGVNPRKAGTSVDFEVAGEKRSISVYGAVAEALEATGADVSVVFVPPAFTKAAVVDAIAAAMPLTVIVTGGIPVKDTAECYARAADQGVARVG